ncbi:hydantoinase B/oxoprolinase family protein [Fibrella forsythiae]|uniref:Hydantoinase B/oxoprolinase family protein n=1 Tax=Fibrella forsythiae TaxID=2817061 RepID=A0ABS3JJY1_9BACT|nr:hydantoinase B/oxoprolinase family protein [Fibrella forsythiae]MBO0950301.1 hydantoinase B/oxoprolinase family protein [Fibrella forsythiae]
MWQIWIDTGGTFTDGLARDPSGDIHRAKVLSSSRLRGQLINGRVVAPWLAAPIFDGYTLCFADKEATYLIKSLTVDGQLILSEAELSADQTGTVELFTGEEAPVLAARLLTQTPLNQPFPVLEMRLGTTRGTNALLERRGGRVALLVTEGFRDLLVIGTQQRPDLFQLAIPPADVLYESVIDVPERTAANGDVLTPLSDEAIQQLIDQVRSAEPDAVAISLLNAYQNPTHEQQLAEALTTAGFAIVTTSTSLSTAPGYVSRTQTAVINAYLTPALATYLSNVQTQLGGWPVRVMTSAGGLVRADLFQPKDSLLSGPAGGVIGAAAVARNQAVLTLDMGGTSTDVARLENGLPDYRFSTPIGPFDLQLPSLAIETVAAGGGSICWFDALTGQLRVGPKSAGANPGPACYGVGGPLTITDVNMLLGKLDPKQFGIPVFPEQAQAALDVILRQVSQATGEVADAQALLQGFKGIADEIMAGAIRKISVSRGFDPVDYGLLVFGGAGGLHGCSVANLLNMNRLILPFDGGLLSAYGIGQAQVERRASRSVLQPLSTISDQLPHWIDALTRQATNELHRDLDAEQAHVSAAATLFLRLQGQEATVPIAMTSNPADLEAAFRQDYQRLYGHLPEGRAIEVESLRVTVSTARPPSAVDQPESRQKTPAEPAFHTGTYPAYDWTTLRAGDTFTGPALLLNTTSSAFLETGWQATVQADKTVAATLETKPAAQTAVNMTSTVIQLELFTQRFRAIAEEMGAQLQRTAFSVNVKERLDFSCALLDANARLVVNAPHIPVHLGSLGVCARLTLAKLELNGTPLCPGDVAVTNHPNYGGSHLPDVTLLQAVFAEDQTLIGYVINRAHHAEIGGKTPGSMPPDAISLVEEGVVLEPQLLVRNGHFLWETGSDGQPESGLAYAFSQATYPTRALAENRADLEAAIASLRAGEMALQNLVRAHGLETVHHYMERLQQSATDAIRGVLTQYDGQEFTATETLDDGHAIQVRMSVRAGRSAGAVSKDQQLTIDLRGTGAVHPNNLNANVSILHSAVLYVLRLWVGEQIDATNIPLNEGLMAPVRFILPESSFLNPVFSENAADCPAVVGGNTEVSQRLVDTLLKALGLAACSQGTMNNFLFGNDSVGYYETIGGGAGAIRGQAGRSGVHQHMTNTKLTDPETLERRYPVRLWRFCLRANSGGAGEWRGGDGLLRELEFLAPLQATLVSQHRVVAPYGLDGGGSGAVGQQTLILPDGKEETLPGLFTRQMLPGERIRLETPGGGGVGSV